jgi:pimeloyl-ACP methyl ester carboxylesterase
MTTDCFAVVNGTHIYYEMIGEGDALVLIHSGYTDSRLWDDQFELFGKYFKVIRYDVRGFGRSGKPSETFSYYEDLKELLNYLGINKVHLVGVSMGGSIAIDFTLQYPDLVENLVLSGSSLNGYLYANDEASKQRSLAGMSIIKRDENFNQAVEFMLDNPMWRQRNLKTRQRLKNMFVDTSLEWALDDLVQIATPHASERLSEITKRTLLIVGSEDSLPIIEIANVLDSGITMAKKITLNDTGHLPNLDKPEEFNKIVLDFLLNSKI